MGKTLPPCSSLIEQERRRWVPFKKALPKADQVLFDRLFDCAKLHMNWLRVSHIGLCYWPKPNKRVTRGNKHERSRSEDAPLALVLSALQHGS